MSPVELAPDVIRDAMLPYGRQSVSEEDIRLVVEVLRSDWLTTGPAVERFERAFAKCVGAAEAVAVSSGTAALHAAMFALAIGPGDEVIVPAMTFAATANAVVFQGATPVFADVSPDTLLVDPADVERRITPRTRAIVAVDYAGQPCDYSQLRPLARRRGLALVADAAHSLGAADFGSGNPRVAARQDGRPACALDAADPPTTGPVGSLADLSTFSLHPVKAITTGEGGVVTTGDAGLAERIRRFRNHGFNRDHRGREAAGSWHYEMTELGYNYRLTDIQSALGLGQLAKLEGWVARRGEIAARYDRVLAGMEGVRPLAVRSGVRHAWHLYVIRLEAGALGSDRRAVYEALRRRRIGVGVHYLPVHLHPFYRRRFGTAPGLCPNAEAAYEEILSLPIFPAMSDDDVEDVICALEQTIKPMGADPTPLSRERERGRR